MVGKEILIASLNGARGKHEELQCIKRVRARVCACSALTEKTTELLEAYLLFFYLDSAGGVSGSNTAQERPLLRTAIARCVPFCIFAGIWTACQRFVWPTSEPTQRVTLVTRKKHVVHVYRISPGGKVTGVTLQVHTSDTCRTLEVEDRVIWVTRRPCVPIYNSTCVSVRPLRC